MYKFLHLICSTTFFGLIIASFFYITTSLKKADKDLLAYSLKTSYYADAIILACICILFFTATKLVIAGNFSLSIPWIQVAYLAFISLSILWLINISIKYFYFVKPVIYRPIKTIFYAINITMILLFVIIIHDAVTQSTWFDFLFRK